MVFLIHPIRAHHHRRVWRAMDAITDNPSQNPWSDFTRDIKLKREISFFSGKKERLVNWLLTQSQDKRHSLCPRTLIKTNGGDSRGPARAKARANMSKKNLEQRFFVSEVMCYAVLGLVALPNRWATAKVAQWILYKAWLFSSVILSQFPKANPKHKEAKPPSSPSHTWFLFPPFPFLGPSLLCSSMETNH